MTDLEIIKNTLLDKIRESVNETLFELWFQDLKILKFTEKIIFFSVESEIQLIRINDKYLSQLKEWIKECLDCTPEIKIYSNQYRQVTESEISRDERELLKRLDPDSLKEEFDGQAGFDESKISQNTDNTDQNDKKNDDNGLFDNMQSFRLEHTFDNFVVGNSNRYTYTVCTVVAKNPATNYNPLFIYAPSGLGKTHLLYAIKNEYEKNNGNSRRSIYVRGEDFTNQLIDSLSDKNASYFREKYRNADILLVDDIQFIAGKQATQEEFFHTFNSLYESKKQIVLTSDCPPKDIKFLEERLTSRFESGLITDIQPPDLELRIAILKRKAEGMGISVSNDVLLFLAENITSNIRQIEGAIKKLNAYSYVNNSVITPELARASISDILSGTEPVNVTIEKVINHVARQFNISVEEIKGRKRTKNISFARHVAIYIIRKITDISLPAIGKIFDRDHSSIISAINSITLECETNALLRSQIDDISKISCP